MPKLRSRDFLFSSQVKKNVQENLGGKRKENKTENGRDDLEGDEGGRGKDEVEVEGSYDGPTELSLPVPCCRRRASETRGLNGDLT